MLKRERMIYLNLQATFASVAMALQKGNAYQMVADIYAAKGQVEKGPRPHTRLEEVQVSFEGTIYWVSIDLLQGYWQTPLHEDAQNVITMVTQDGLFTPKWVPQGVQDVAEHFQATMEHEVLDDMMG